MQIQMTPQGRNQRLRRGIPLDAPRGWVRSDSPDYPAYVRRLLTTNIIVTSGQCWEWQKARDKAGYGLSSWKGLTMKATRVSWIAFRGPLKPADWVLHKCDNPPCINPQHLYIGTAADNARDRKIRGRGAKGERHGCAKLTAAEVQEIRALYRGRGHGPSYETLMRQFGVSKSTIAHIAKGQTWDDFLKGAASESGASRVLMAKGGFQR
jgi:hypothetical protein